VPQLLNVLSGDMSLVGPRPPIPYEVEAYELWHRKRLDMKPGLTGLWQVSGRNRLPFEEMVRLDLFYIENWSLLLDLKIILRTGFVMLGGEGF
jgi:lipopolysaccharide/colanic/teichoic acid biosynthesis glycosyltransferase